MRASAVLALLAATFVAASPLGSSPASLAAKKSTLNSSPVHHGVCTFVCHSSGSECGSGMVAVEASKGCFNCCAPPQ
ncbi:hypothetical protein BOTBODRAFT_38486 [Botryobasidium botryosum FD-172 SS1]|uniref:Uncharacterized protein n=1 Tax=Botryobasidium botryosum (strain FD-172 SS1) TaxID=930990 RepID=A0A067LZK6_BOTB1|nr:hypothetical protein BOTBODRAFT_38486 [Botryobasidium botryosum FD-172 SS1]